jgi:myosin heavy chain 6/7
MLDAAKLADELRVEQEAAQAMEQDRKDMEQRVHDLQIHLDEAEQNALKWGRKMIAKLDNRIKELEGELVSIL